MTTVAIISTLLAVALYGLWLYEREQRRLEQHRHEVELRHTRLSAEALEREIERLRSLAQRPPIRLPVILTPAGPLTTLYRN